MHVNADALNGLTYTIRPSQYLRCTPLAHRRTPLGMGHGETRFASPSQSFKLLYVGEDLATSIAEAILRDRFETGIRREIMLSEIETWGACEVSATTDLKIVDLRPRDACFQLEISTDITGAKCHDEARLFSQHIYDNTDLDGLLYHSRLIGRDCVAIYDRAVVAKLQSSAVEDLSLLADLVPSLENALNVGLIR